VRDDSKPVEYRQRRERELRAQIAGVNEEYERKLNQAALDAYKDPQRRMATGSGWKPEQITEAALYADQYRGRTQIEQRQLVADIAADLAAGATDQARIKARAAQTLGIGLGAVAVQLRDADPAVRGARDEHDVIEGLTELGKMEAIRELAQAGLASSVERVAAKSFAADRGLRPDAPFPAQVEPGYAGLTVERNGFPNAPFPEPHDPELDRQRERVEHTRDVGGETVAEVAARYEAR
jgi:hypothetical protein